MSNTMALIRGAIVRLSLPDERGVGPEGLFYGALAEQVRFEANAQMPTLARIGVDRNAMLRAEVHPVIFEALPPDERAALILHELLHVVMGHVYETPDPTLDRKAKAIAVDVSVNQMIPAGLPLPSGPWQGWTLDILNALRAEADLPPVGARLPWEAYYRAYLELPPPPPKEGAEPTDGFDSHGDSDVPSDIAEAAVGKALAAAQATAQAAGGAVPEAVAEAVRRAGRQSSMRWREALRAFAQSAMSADFEFTRRRPSRRFGFSQPGRRRELTAKIVFAVDTSASMDSAQLARVLPEIERLSQLAEVEVVDIDTEIRRTWRARGRIEVAEFEGRGGTAFTPLFDAVKSGRFGAVDGVIYFTDGYGDHPEPCGVPTLWLLTDERALRQRFGRSVVLPTL